MPATPALLVLLGFTAFERNAFESFFSLGREHGPGYELTPDLWRAECAVANADDPEAVAYLMHAGLMERTVLLGHTQHLGAAALQLPRPINLLLVMRALDTLVGARPRTSARSALATEAGTPPIGARPAQALGQEHPRAHPVLAPSASPAPTSQPESHSQAADDGPASLPPSLPEGAAPLTAREKRALRGSTQVQRVLDDLAFRTATLPSHLDARAYAAQAIHTARTEAAPEARRRPAALGRPDPLARTRSAVLPMEHILVVDHDAATLRLVAVQLQRFGFQVHLAGHPEDALRRLGARFHDYVFVDPALPGVDALLICRLAKQVTPPGDRPATTVVLLADPAAPAAPLERALPAADACLRKPLQQAALLKLMGEREVARVAYADTTRTTTII